MSVLTANAITEPGLASRYPRIKRKKRGRDSELQNREKVPQKKWGETEKAKGWGEISESGRTARVSEGGGTGRSEPRRMDSGSRTGTARARDGRRGTATVERRVADADPVSTVDRCPGLCSEQNVENGPVLPN